MRGSRSSCSEIFYRKAFMKHSAKFGGKYLWWSLQTYQKDSITSYYHSWNHLLPWGEGLSFLNSNKKMGLDFSHKKKGFGKTRENYCSKKGYNLFSSLLPQSDVKFTSGWLLVVLTIPISFLCVFREGFRLIYCS